MARVWAAMSGGVDSSLAAALLLDEGHEVTGVTMRLLADEGACCGRDAARDARRVCDLLGIEHLTLDFRDTFEREVVGPYADAYAAGRTPNPCIECNDRVKFGGLLRRARAAGADALATGHYARVVDAGGVLSVARGVDTRRDQSYFLYRLTPGQLEHVLFRVGGLTKPQVRDRASALGLPTAERAESREACFVADGAVAAFVGARHPSAMAGGPVVTADGDVLGEHHGIAGLTVGQRKGIGIAAGRPLHVLAIDARTGTVTVGEAGELAVTEIRARDVVWEPARAVAPLTARVRYLQEDVACEARADGGILSVRLAVPVRGVAPGQAVVCYAGEAVVGGGVIESAR